MARARNIKPGFFSNDRLAEINPLGRLLFAGLWTIADRAGRLEDRPKKIKAEVLPYDDCDADAMLDELAGKDFLLRYQADGKRYIQIINFAKHQNPHKKEAESTIPAPDEHRASSVPEPEKEHTSRADCGVLIPDSGFPSNPLSGKPDPEPPKKLNGSAFYPDAEDVLGYLNRLTGKGFEFRNRAGEVTASGDRIVARLKQGYTRAELREVVHAKCEQWKDDDKMAEFLRPATLFAKENFEQYLGELKVHG